MRKAQLLAGAASCWRGFLRAWLLADDWRNGGIKTTRKQGRCYRAWTDPWRPVASRDFFADPFVASQDPLFASQDPLGLSPEDDLRPPARRPSLSLSGGRPTAPYEGENLYPEIGRTAPCEGGNLLSEVGRTPGPCVSPLTGENKRGLAAPGGCDFPIG